MTFARARVAPGGFQARVTRDDTGSATSRELVGTACRAFVLRRERLTRRVATRAASGDGESLERRRSSLPRERNDETTNDDVGARPSLRRGRRRFLHRS
jgi:hypothetical protein